MLSSIIIGLTGPTGAGKSTAAKIIEKMGYTLLDADFIAKEVINSSDICLNALKDEFGSDVLNDDKAINRKLLSYRAFESSKSLKRLNEITHPHIVKKLEKIIDEIKSQGKNAVIDAALLFESGADKFCNFTIAVLAPKKIRISRIMHRDNISKIEAGKRVNLQNTDNFYKMNCDYILNGRKSVLSLCKDVSEIILRGIADLNACEF